MLGRSLFSNETFTDGFVLLGMKSGKYKWMQWHTVVDSKDKVIVKNNYGHVSISTI